MLSHDKKTGFTSLRGFFYAFGEARGRRGFLPRAAASKPDMPRSPMETTP